MIFFFFRRGGKNSLFPGRTIEKIRLCVKDEFEESIPARNGIFEKHMPQFDADKFTGLDHGHPCSRVGYGKDPLIRFNPFIPDIFLESVSYLFLG